MNFSNRLKELRQKYNVSQKDVADLLGVSPRAVRFYETGEREPTIEGLIRMSNFFCVSLDYLVARSNEPRHEEYLDKAEEDLISQKPIQLIEPPISYEDPMQRYKNYSIDTRLKILFLARQVIQDWNEDLRRHQEAVKSFEGNLNNDVTKLINSSLEKVGLRKPRIYEVDRENNKKKVQHVEELMSLLHKRVS